MAGGKEIRSKIASIKSTQKITAAMQTVAASKMRKAQDRMAASRPYAEKMLQVINHLYYASPEYQHSFIAKDRPRKKIGYIIVSSDRGLCGGLNTNLFRKLVAEIREQRKLGVDPAFCPIGSKALAFFRRFGGNVLAEATRLGDKPHVADLIGPVKVMLNAFEAGEIDAIYVVFNRFVNTMTQQPTLDTLLQRYIESLVYQVVVENNACEQSARMVAMKAATDNAGNLIDELQLVYNKARQAAITQEIAEIVGGAAAV